MPRQSISALEHADALVAARIGRHKHKRWAAPLLAWGALSDQEPMFAMAATTGLVGLLGGDATVTRTAARMAAGVAVATLIKSAIKHSVDRTRPRILVERGEYVSGAGHHFESDYNSFPSGHTADAVAVARAIVREYPATATPAYLGAATAGVAQVVKRNHYPTDIVAGLVVGLVADAIVDRLFARFVPRPQPLP